MTARDWINAIGFNVLLIGQLVIVESIENPKPRKEVSNTCVVDGRTVYCILPKSEPDNH